MRNPFRLTTDGIVAGFNRSIQKLEKVRQRELVRSAAHAELADKHSRLSSEAMSEASHAHRVANKLTSLIS